MPLASLVSSNVSVLVATHVANRFFFLALAGGIGWLRGSGELGGYAIAAAVATIFLFITDLGLSPLMVREVAAKPHEGRTLYQRAFGSKLLLSVAAVAALPVVHRLLPYEPWVADSCVLLSVAAVVESFSHLNNAVCRAHQRADLEAFAALTQSIVTVIPSFAFLLMDLPIVWLGWAAILGSVAELFVSTYSARRFVRTGVTLGHFRDTLKQASPYAVTSLNAVGFFQAEILILSLIVTEAQVGQFASVSRLLQGAGYLPILAAGALLPTVTVAFLHQERDRFRSVGSLWLRGSLLVGLAMAAAMWFGADFIMRVVYGPTFVDAAWLLRLGTVYLLVRCFGEAMSVLLTAAGRQVTSALSRIGGAITSWILLFLLTPAFGIAGAVVALVLGEALAAATQLSRGRDLMRTAELARAAAALGFGTAVAAGIWVGLRSAGYEGLAIVIGPVALALLAHRSWASRVALPPAPRPDT